MLVHYRESKSNWNKEYYVKKWCCIEFEEDAKNLDIEIINNMIQFSTCEDEGIQYLPFFFRYCPYCAKKIRISG